MFSCCSFCKFETKQQHMFISKPKHGDPISVKEKFIQMKVFQGIVLLEFLSVAIVIVLIFRYLVYS